MNKLLTIIKQVVWPLPIYARNDEGVILANKHDPFLVDTNPGFPTDPLPVPTPVVDPISTYIARILSAVTALIALKEGLEALGIPIGDWLDRIF